MVAEFRPNLTYHAGRGDETFDRYLATANPTIFVAEHHREVVGLLIALTHDFLCAYGFFAIQEVFYVRPDKRGSRAAAELAIAFNEWADRLGPEEVYMGVATGYRPAAARRFMQRFGFEPVGDHLRRICRRKP